MATTTQRFYTKADKGSDGRKYLKDLARARLGLAELNSRSIDSGNEIGFYSYLDEIFQEILSLNVGRVL